MARFLVPSLVFATTCVAFGAVQAQTTPTSPIQNPTQNTSTEGAKPVLNAPERPVNPAPPTTPAQRRTDAESMKAEQSKPPTGAAASPRTSEGAPMQKDDIRTMEEKKKAEQNKPQ